MSRSKKELLRVHAEAAADLDRIGDVLEPRINAMKDAMNGWPKSTRLDADSGPSTTTFCEQHEKERCPCGAGTTYASRSDRTGETAMLPDQAADHLRRLDSVLSSVQRLTREAVYLLDQYAVRPATETERRQTLSDNERDVSCWSCARIEVAKGVPRWEPAWRPVDLAGERRQVCRWCFDWLRKVGELPTVHELSTHHRGVRVRRPA